MGIKIPSFQPNYLNEYPNAKHRATIDVNSLEELNKLSAIAFQGLIVTGNEITIYDGYNE